MNDGSTNPLTSDSSSHFPMPEALRIDDSKITNYLLNHSHQEGASKAAFFKSVGFANHETELFRATMREHAKANPVAKTESHSYGTKFVVDCFVAMPNGDRYCIRTVWNDHGDGLPARLITAHPLG